MSLDNGKYALDLKTGLEAVSRMWKRKPILVFGLKESLFVWRGLRSTSLWNGSTNMNASYAGVDEDFGKHLALPAAAG